MARPHPAGEAEKIRASRGLRGEVFGEPAVPLHCVAPPTGGHYVSRGIVAAPHPRLHVVHGERLGREHLPAVDAPVPVAREDVLTLQWSTP